VETEADFFNRIDPKLTMATGKKWPKAAVLQRPIPTSAKKGTDLFSISVQKGKEK
jgi:hypothetical protein